MRLELSDLLNQRSPVRACRLFFGRNDHRRRHPVSGFDIEQAHTLRRTPRLADEFRFDADDLAVLADQHNFGVFIHLRDADDLAVPLRSLHIDHPFAAAGNQTILVSWGTLAISVFRNGQDERAFFA